MEALDREFARQAKRLDPSKVAKPVEVETLADVKRVLSEFDPSFKANHKQREIPVATEMTILDSSGPVTYKVEAPTKSKSKRDLLLEGLDVIKGRANIEEQLQTNDDEDLVVNGRNMKPAPLGNGVTGMSWVDPLIKHRLGGRRDGMVICWDLKDGYTYRYDAFTHNLTRVETVSDQSK
jgi:hypothetical protein